MRRRNHIRFAEKQDWMRQNDLWTNDLCAQISVHQAYPCVQKNHCSILSKHNVFVIPTIILNWLYICVYVYIYNTVIISYNILMKKILNNGPNAVWYRFFIIISLTWLNHVKPCIKHVLLSIYCHPRNIKHPLTRSKYVVSSPTKPWFLRVGERDSEPYLSIYSSYSLIVIAMIPMKYPQDRWNPWLRWSDLLWRWVIFPLAQARNTHHLWSVWSSLLFFPINIFNSLFQLILFF